MILVSIIIPIYNSSKYLNKLLSDIVDQTYKNIEIILIDDGSEDNSLEICKNFQHKDERIKIISQKNQGVSSARNEGIECATGKCVTFIDSDDTVDKSFIEVLVNNVENDCLVKVNNKKINKNKLVARQEYLKEIISGKILGVSWGYLFERDLLKNINFDINTSYMEDTIFIVQYLFKVKKIKVLKERLYYHQNNYNSLTNSNELERKINEYMYSIDKIEYFLKENHTDEKIFKNIIENRRVKLIEAEISKAKSSEEIQNIINNRNVMSIMKLKKIKFKYKLFIKILSTRNSKKIFKYVKFRNKIKKVLRGK